MKERKKRKKKKGRKVKAKILNKIENKIEYNYIVLVELENIEITNILFIAPLPSISLISYLIQIIK